ncbi:hypothetical protein CAPTEDRAFT_176469 [Capitella teleta]|uniref:alkaline phosphatase n=1 Tax=Capitella teleta TaxID=283909 RepID=R7V6S8_CAPTE|nr:hypothetical protein CAPTEDRAFT_176469 [Capitella teleta]|eukprot:ELU14152.1 hypothetical protein CAPTEDRAFT_176469 [Capitella teleta]
MRNVNWLRANTRKNDIYFGHSAILIHPQYLLYQFLTHLFPPAHAASVSHHRHGTGETAAKKRSPRSGHEADWKRLAQEALERNIEALKPRVGVAKNAVFFIGDGMGMTSITGARWHMKQDEDLIAYEAELSWDKFPTVGLSKTYNTDIMTPDSAGTATAFLCGEKAREGVIGVNQDVHYGECETMTEDTELDSILKIAQTEDKWTGLVTTTRITHATPAASYAHSAHRYWENDNEIPDDQKEACPDMEDIAKQLVYSETGQNLKVIFGGGRSQFRPNTTMDPEYSDYPGFRGDGRDLIAEWISLKTEAGVNFHYVQNQTQFDNIDVENVDHVLGLFNPGHMNYEADRADDIWGEPSLEEMVQKAITILERSPNGYILFVESGRIDHAHHDTNANRALIDTYQMQKAVGRAIAMTSPDETLTVVSADHSHAFAISGYPDITTDIYGYVYEVSSPADPYLADDDKPYTTLAYANGPGWYTHRNGSLRIDMNDLPEDEKPGMGNVNFLQDAGVPFNSETHGGEDVPVYANGPMAYLLAGTYEQSYIPHVIMYATCIGDNRDLCTSSAVSLQASLWMASVLAWLLSVHFL